MEDNLHENILENETDEKEVSLADDENKENNINYSQNPELDPENVVVMKNITRVFGTLVANNNITLQLRKGEIHALLGENGAGKSTLMSILFGLYPPTSGEIYIRGKETKIKDPNHATSLGIGMVHQHFMLVEKYTAIQNIVLGVEDTVGGIFITYKKAREKLNKLMDDYGLHVDLDCQISDMSVGMQQKVEILKMLYRDSEILIFDEPTAVLTEMEIEELMKIIKSLKAEGKAILFISHKLNEVREISDRVTVLRKGKYIGTFNTADYDNEGLAELMVGKRVNFKTDKKEANPGDVVLDISNLNIKKADSKKLAVEDFNLQVRKGEIIAVAGIDGNGQDELVAAITGLTKAKSGEIKLNGVDISKLKIKKRNNLGINHIPGDRHKYGLVLDYNVMYNMVLENVSNGDFSKAGFLKPTNIRKYSDELVQKYDIRSSMGSYTITRGMSGGNQQKVIVAREIERHGDLLIAVQPTRGLDVGAIETIHKEIVKVRDSNKAVLLVSLEIDEVFNLADTIYTIYEGRITGKFKPAETTFKEIGLYETGAACQEEYKKPGVDSEQDLLNAIDDVEESTLTEEEVVTQEETRIKEEEEKAKAEEEARLKEEAIKAKEAEKAEKEEAKKQKKLDALKEKEEAKAKEEALRQEEAKAKEEALRQEEAKAKEEAIQRTLDQMESTTVALDSLKVYVDQIKEKIQKVKDLTKQLAEDDASENQTAAHHREVAKEIKKTEKEIKKLMKKYSKGIKLSVSSMAIDPKVSSSNSTSETVKEDKSQVDETESQLTEENKEIEQVDELEDKVDLKEDKRKKKLEEKEKKKALKLAKQEEKRRLKEEKIEEESKENESSSEESSSEDKGE